MDDNKRSKLENAGWKVGTTEEFLHEPVPPDKVDAAVKTVIAGLTTEDFAFGIDAIDGRWDIYRFKLDGQSGMIGVRVDSDTVVIGLFRFGEWTEAECKAHLNEHPDN